MKADATATSLSPPPASIRDFSLSAAGLPGRCARAVTSRVDYHYLPWHLLPGSRVGTPYDKGAAVMARVRAADATCRKSGTNEMRVRIRMRDAYAM